MRFEKILFAGILVLAAAPEGEAAVKFHEVSYRQAIREGRRVVYEPHRRTFAFRMEIVSDAGGVKRESLRDGRPYVAASRGERYSVRLTNPLPVRVAVNLTVDGLNSITGRPGGPAEGPKWVIEPYGSVTIPGWQVSSGEARRFFFTDKRASYAAWREEETGLDLSANCGVIGAAFFWSQKELDRRLTARSVVRHTGRGLFHDDVRSRKAPGEAAAMREGEEAGTGMGEREHHPTVRVDFDYDAGMYSPSEALVVFYGFEEPRRPNPFPVFGYAPQMP